MIRDIVVEGVDNTGKSTLGRMLAHTFQADYIPGEGPEKYPGENNERLKRFAQYPIGQVFDRHTAISQNIYATLYGGSINDEELVQQFYARKPVIIYCRPPDNRGMEGHIAKDKSDEEFAELVRKGYSGLLRLYDEWALDKAHIIYRMGQNHQEIVSMVKRLIS